MGLNYRGIIILVFSISVTANENSQLYVPCKPGWYFFGEKCYKLLRTGSQTEFNLQGLGFWDISKLECQHIGGHLASIHSHELQEFITAFLLLNEKTSAWIGLAQHINETGRCYYWEDGSVYNYTNWFLTELIWNRDGCWSDKKMEVKKRNRKLIESRRKTGGGRNTEKEFIDLDAAERLNIEESDNVPVSCIDMHYDIFSSYKIGYWSMGPCWANLPYICQVNRSDDENSADPRFCSLEEGGGWKYVNSCYHIVKEEKSWEDAERYCEERYTGYLVSVLDHDSDHFQNYIQRLSNLTENVWIGIKMRNNSLQKWSSGWHVVYKKWNQEQLHFVNGTCALKSNGSWSVAPCHSKYPFICEKIKYKVPVLKRPPSDDWKCPNSSIKWIDLEGESCYYIENQNFKNWTEANNECRKIGGSLASFHSENETNILHPHVFDKKELLWIGIKRSPENNPAFEWEDGTEVIYQNWELGEIERLGWSNMQDLRCGQLWTGSMKWRINSCYVPQKYICKSKKVLSN